MAGTVFISYGHADMQPENWLNRLRLYLSQSLREGGIVTWDDHDIAPGTDWRDNIAHALEHCDAAILLIGPAFLASRFVMNEELPRLLALAKDRDISIFPLIIAHCGYTRSRLSSCQSFNNPDMPLEALPRHDQNRILNDLAIAVGDTVIAKSQSNRHSRPNSQSNLAAMRGIRHHLSLTKQAFVSQVGRRNELVDMIERRLAFKSDLEYEKFFFRYYPKLTREEKFIFDQIRALTTGPLQRSNQAILDLLESHHQLLEEVSSLLALHQHLVFWLNKFHLVFERNEAMCLLYTGVEDAVPFPERVDADIDRWLATTGG